MGPAGFVAVIAGWVTTEVGRQPFTVYGQLLHARTPCRRSARRRCSSRSSPSSSSTSPSSAPAPGTSCSSPREGAAAERARPAARRRSARAGHHPGAGPRGRSDSRGGAAMIEPSTCRSSGPASSPSRVFAYVVMDGFDLGIGILFPAFERRRGARPGDERHRAGLGRQRDLAGAGRRRPARGLPARLCDHPAGDLSADDRHAARPRLPRRRLRVPLARPGPPRRSGTSPSPSVPTRRRSRRA